jgi:HEAT repeat protein
MQDKVEELIGQLSDPDAEVRATAARRLGGHEDERAVGPLLDVLESDPSPKVRCFAVLSLGDFEWNKTGEILLRHLREDPFEGVRWISVTVAERLGGAEGARAVVDALDDRHHMVRYAAVSAIKRRKDPIVAGKLFEMLDDDNSSVRINVCEALMELGAADDRVVQTLMELSAYPDVVQARDSVVGWHQAWKDMRRHPESAGMIAFMQGIPVNEKGSGVAREILEEAREKVGDVPDCEPPLTLPQMLEKARRLVADEGHD